MTFEKIQKQLAAQLNVKPEVITMQTDVIKDLKADSLDIVEMIMTLEEEFNITVPEDKASQFKTVGDLVAFIDSVKK